MIISDVSDKHLIIIFSTYLLLEEYTFKKKKKTNLLSGIDFTYESVRNVYQMSIKSNGISELSIRLIIEYLSYYC